MVALTTIIVVTTITWRNKKVNGSVEFGKAKRQTCDFFKTTNKNSEWLPEFRQLRHSSRSLSIPKEKPFFSWYPVGPDPWPQVPSQTPFSNPTANQTSKNRLSLMRSGFRIGPGSTRPGPARSTPGPARPPLGAGKARRATHRGSARAGSRAPTGPMRRRFGISRS